MKKRIITLSIILVALLGIFGISVGIVHNSYSAENYVKQGMSSEETTEPEETEVVEQSKDFDLENGKGSLHSAFSIYNSDNIEERQKAFLNTDCSVYDEIYENYADIRGSLLRESFIDTENIVKYSSTIDEPNLDLSELQSYDYAIFDRVLTVVGMYDNTCLLCAYNYPSTDALLFIDFSEYQFSTNSESGLYDFGSIVDVSIMPKLGVVKSIRGKNVLYVKA